MSQYQPELSLIVEPQISHRRGYACLNVRLNGPRLSQCETEPTNCAISPTYFHDCRNKPCQQQWDSSPLASRMWDTSPNQPCTRRLFGCISPVSPIIATVHTLKCYHLVHGNHAKGIRRPWTAAGRRREVVILAVLHPARRPDLLCYILHVPACRSTFKINGLGARGR